MKPVYLFLGLLLILSSSALGAHSPPPLPAPVFSFALTADMRLFAGPGTYDSSSYFRGAVEGMSASGAGAFMISPGDIDPPEGVRWTISQVLGAGYRWVPVIGNHESETTEDMAWLRAYDYGDVNPGPAACPQTTYSFDYANAHFAVINQYCDSAGDTVTDGDMPDYLYNWLAADLAAATMTHNFVIGHEPLYPLPDMDNGRLRHVGDSLDGHPQNRDRFLQLLSTYDAIYLCGHTHNASVGVFGNVWQIDAGHARGLGDTGARSTFVLIDVWSDHLTYAIYRDDSAGGAYSLAHSGAFTEVYAYLPLIQR